MDLKDIIRINDMCLNCKLASVEGEKGVVCSVTELPVSNRINEETCEFTEINN